MKIAITGVNGLLGSSLFAKAKSFNFQVIELARNGVINNNSISELASYLKLNNITVVLHCAANTNVEDCEVNKEQCFLDNVLLTEKLALACEISNIKFVFISSTGVYGNYQNSPYTEYDEVFPTTIHHKSKLLAEQRVSQLAGDSLIIRTGWLFGGSWHMKKNFVANIIKEALSTECSIKSDTSQVGNPTFVDDLSSNIYNLIENKYSGVFNCINSGRATRYEYVSEIIKLSALRVTVLPTDGASFNRLAKVSHNESAVNFKLDAFGENKMPCWKQSLSKYIQSIRSEYE